MLKVTQEGLPVQPELNNKMLFDIPILLAFAICPLIILFESILEVTLLKTASPAITSSIILLFIQGVAPVPL